MMEKTMLTLKEYSSHSGIGLDSVRRLAHIDGFPSLRIGVKIMIHADAADKWLADVAKKEKLDRAS